MRSAVKSIALTPQRSTDPLEHVDYRLAVTPEEKDKIYRLRYRAYLREGAIVPSASERVTDRYDDAPNTWTFGIYLHGELYSSIRVSVLNSEWRGSPSSDMFADIVHPELDRGLTIIDPTRFVADPEKAKRFPELPYVTVRLGWIACGGDPAVQWCTCAWRACAGRGVRASGSPSASSRESKKGARSARRQSRRRERYSGNALIYPPSRRRPGEQTPYRNTMETGSK